MFYVFSIYLLLLLLKRENKNKFEENFFFTKITKIQDETAKCLQSIRHTLNIVAINCNNQNKQHANEANQR